MNLYQFTMKNKALETLPFRKIRAINDTQVINFIKQIFKKNNNLYKSLNDKNIHSKFLKLYINWIKSSKLNKLKNLNLFKFACFSNGSSQAFDYFYAKYNNRNFRVFKGEYVYHKLSWRNHFPKWKYINKTDFKTNDALIISLPFSDTGSKSYEYELTGGISEAVKIGKSVGEELLKLAGPEFKKK